MVEAALTELRNAGRGHVARLAKGCCRSDCSESPIEIRPALPWLLVQVNDERFAPELLMVARKLSRVGREDLQIKQSALRDDFPPVAAAAIRILKGNNFGNISRQITLAGFAAPST